MSLQLNHHADLSPDRDRRRHPRMVFDCPAHWVNGSQERPGWARDVSESGAGFTCSRNRAPEIGQSIRLVFELDPEREWVVDERAIVTRRRVHDDGLCDVGVRLLPLP